MIRRLPGADHARLALALAFLGLACGGDPDPRDEAADRAPVPADTAAADAPAGRSPAADTTPPGTPSADPAAPVPAPGAGDAGDGLPGWRTPPVTGGAEEGPQARLDAVRTGRHDGYDRVVFEFADLVPGYLVERAVDPHQCGSGNPIDIGAPVALRVRFRSAVAHTEEGRPTVADRDRRPGLAVLRTARLTCDFEGDVEWLLGLERATEVRVLVLESPARLVLDLRH